MHVPFCWEWWIDANIHEGRGEVADLAEIVKEVQHDYQVDPNRIHIAGLSSGAGDGRGGSGGLLRNLRLRFADGGYALQ